jgi:DNA-binding transcriptional regulator YiaG
MGGMTTQEIKDLRKGLGFKNAVRFARYLGVGDSTVKRWESRSCYPSTAHRMLLKLAASGVDLSAVKNCNRNQSGE